jgi:CcmD family protein
MDLGVNGWIVAVNLIIWTGLFLYLLRLGKGLRRAERDPEKNS